MKKIKLSRYLKKYWLTAILSPLFMIVEVAVDLYQPLLMSNIVNEGILNGRGTGYIIETGLKMLLLVAVGGTFGMLCAWTASIASQGFGNDVRVDAFGKVMKLSLQQTDKFTTGSLVTRLTNDITTIQEFVMMILRMFVRAPLFLVGGVYMCLSLNVNFGYVMLASVPVMLVFVIILVVRANPLFSLVQKKLDRVNSVVQENITGARVIKAYTREPYEVGRFDSANTDNKNTNYKVMKLTSLIMPILMIIMNLSVVAIIYIGGLQVEAREIQVGDIMAGTQYVTRVLMSIMMVSMMFQQISRAKACGDRVREVIASDCAIASGDAVADSENDSGVMSGTVSISNVDFAYPNSSGDAILSGIDFEAKRGETIAIIGATGSGKSSLVSLIPRFYDVQSGSVAVDGVDVREWDTEELRKRIGFVLQKSELFSGTVRENILWGKPDATENEIIESAKIAQAHDFIMRLPNGYDSVIAEKGASLSGGQKQRLSIARAVLRRPEIIILDDCTSALDLSTEAKLQAALRENLSGTTVIIIAQRIASVMNADKIALIENSTITAFADHDTLMRESETYRDIYASQMRNGGAPLE